MNNVSVSGWVLSAPVANRLGPHTVYAEFRIGLHPPGTGCPEATVVALCHGRLAQHACSHLDVGDIVEIHGFLAVATEHTAGQVATDRVSVIADQLGRPGRPTIAHRAPPSIGHPTPNDSGPRHGEPS